MLGKFIADFRLPVHESSLDPDEPNCSPVPWSRPCGCTRLAEPVRKCIVECNVALIDSPSEQANGLVDLRLSHEVHTVAPNGLGADSEQVSDLLCGQPLADQL
jgi:hypothetical protein